MVEVIEQMAGPGEHGTAGGVEIFVKRYVHGIEWFGDVADALSRIGRLKKQARSI